MAGEMLQFPHDVYGIALNLEEDQVGTVLLGEYTLIQEGDTVKRTRAIMSAPVGDALVGRVVNPLGLPLDGKGAIVTDQRIPIERIAPGVIDRQPVREPLQTGIKAIDLRPLIPIGRGTARIDHRRPPNGQDRHHSGHDHQPEGRRHDLHLLRDRAKTLDDCAGGEDSDGRGRHGVHDCGGRFGDRAGHAAICGALRRLRHGRILSRLRTARRLLLRRPFEARAGVPRDFAAAAPPARTRGFPGRRLLPALAASRTRGEIERQEWRRIADGATRDRDAGRRLVPLIFRRTLSSITDGQIYPRSATCSTAASVRPSTSINACRR